MVVTAALAYALAVPVYYELHEDDRYQGAILRGGTVLGILIIFVLKLPSSPVALLHFVPYIILAPLVLSSFAHNAVLGRSKPISHYRLFFQME